MKRSAALALVSLFLCHVTLGQQQSITVTPPAFTSSLATQATSINLIGTGINLHKFTWNTTGTVSAGACALQGGSDGVTFGTTIITAQTVTSSGGPTTLTSGVYNYVRLNCTTPITGTGSVTITYTGYVDTPAGDSGAASIVRTTPAMTGYTTDYNSGWITPAQTTDTTANKTVTSTSTLVQVAHFNNVTASAATITAGNGTTNFVTAFSIPANSTLDYIWPTGVVLGSIVTSQGTTSSIVAYFGGKQ